MKDMLGGVKAVIFDLDGTIVDSMDVWVDVDRDFFAKREIPYPNYLKEDLAGMGFTDCARYFKKKFGLPETIEDIKDEWVRMAIGMYESIVPYKPGILEFLEFLKSNKIPTGIATSNSNVLLDAFLDKRGLGKYFDATTTCCDVDKSKPHPDVYLTTAKKLGVKPEDCLVFEDMPEGIMAGKRADMKVCAIEDAHSADRADEKRELADYYISDYGQVTDGTYETLHV